jgi:GMP synthase-like glutamine amidotransferase
MREADVRIGVLMTGRARGDLSERYGEYARMFETLLGAAAPDFSFEIIPVVDGVLPEAPDSCDGWLVTGSKHGVYDDLPWIAPLKAFLRAARARRVPIVGVCFGHQILAEAFGGRAVKHEGGWRLGAHGFDFAPGPGWARGAEGALRLNSVHQDQVVAIPEDATVWATSPGCAYAGLIYGDPERPDAISVQPHPEFEPDFAAALIDLLDADGVVTPEIAAGARASLAPVDNAALGAVFAAYFRAAGA